MQHCTSRCGGPARSASTMPLLPRPACATLRRLHLRQRWVWAWLTFWLALLPTLAPAQGCSPYLGQASINELRIGSSNNSDAKNQIEVFNSGSVPQAVWSTWQLVVYFKGAGRAAVMKDPEATVLVDR